MERVQVPPRTRGGDGSQGYPFVSTETAASRKSREGQGVHLEEARPAAIPFSPPSASDEPSVCPCCASAAPEDWDRALSPGTANGESQSEAESGLDGEGGSEAQSHTLRARKKPVRGRAAAGRDGRESALCSRELGDDQAQAQQEGRVRFQDGEGSGEDSRPAVGETRFIEVRDWRPRQEQVHLYDIEDDEEHAGEEGGAQEPDADDDEETPKSRSTVQIVQRKKEECYCVTEVDYIPRFWSTDLVCYFTNRPKFVLLIKRISSPAVTREAASLAFYMHRVLGLTVIVEPSAAEEMAAATSNALPLKTWITNDPRGACGRSPASRRSQTSSCSLTSFRSACVSPPSLPLSASPVSAAAPSSGFKGRQGRRRESSPAAGVASSGAVLSGSPPPSSKPCQRTPSSPSPCPSACSAAVGGRYASAASSRSSVASSPRPPFRLCDGVDLVVALGGDGTMLWVSRLFEESVPPVLGVSMGSLGYLTRFSLDEARDQLAEMAARKKFSVNLRCRLKVCLVSSDDDVLETFVAFNECVIDRGHSSNLCSLDVYCNNCFFTTVAADGLILATPTGSTAYSMSAGGSMVHPKVPCLLFTPICPHSLSFRPLILPDSVVLRIVAPDDARGSIWIAVDGRSRTQVKRGMSVLVSLSAYPFPMVVRRGASCQDIWLESLKKGLNWNLRIRQGALGGDDWRAAGRCETPQRRTWDEARRDNARRGRADAKKRQLESETDEETRDRDGRRWSPASSRANVSARNAFAPSFAEPQRRRPSSSSASSRESRGAAAPGARRTRENELQAARSPSPSPRAPETGGTRDPRRRASASSSRRENLFSRSIASPPPDSPLAVLKAPRRTDLEASGVDGEGRNAPAERRDPRVSTDAVSTFQGAHQDDASTARRRAHARSPSSPLSDPSAASCSPSSPFSLHLSSSASAPEPRLDPRRARAARASSLYSFPCPSSSTPSASAPSSCSPLSSASSSGESAHPSHFAAASAAHSLSACVVRHLGDALKPLNEALPLSGVPTPAPSHSLQPPPPPPSRSKQLSPEVLRGPVLRVASLQSCSSCSPEGALGLSAAASFPSAARERGGPARRRRGAEEDARGEGSREGRRSRRDAGAESAESDGRSFEDRAAASRFSDDPRGAAEQTVIVCPGCSRACQRGVGLPLSEWSRHQVDHRRIHRVISYAEDDANAEAARDGAHEAEDGSEEEPNAPRQPEAKSRRRPVREPLRPGGDFGAQRATEETARAGSEADDGPVRTKTSPKARREGHETSGDTETERRPHSAHQARADACRADDANRLTDREFAEKASLSREANGGCSDSQPRECDRHQARTRRHEEAKSHEGDEALPSREAEAPVSRARGLESGAAAFVEEGQEEASRAACALRPTQSSSQPVPACSRDAAVADGEKTIADAGSPQVGDALATLDDSERASESRSDSEGVASSSRNLGESMNQAGALGASRGPMDRREDGSEECEPAPQRHAADANKEGATAAAPPGGDGSVLEKADTQQDAAEAQDDGFTVSRGENDEAREPGGRASTGVCAGCRRRVSDPSAQEGVPPLVLSPATCSPTCSVSPCSLISVSSPLAHRKVGAVISRRAADPCAVSGCCFRSVGLPSREDGDASVKESGAAPSLAAETLGGSAQESPCLLGASRSPSPRRQRRIAASSSSPAPTGSVSALCSVSCAALRSVSTSPPSGATTRERPAPDGVAAADAGAPEPRGDGKEAPACGDRLRCRRRPPTGDSTEAEALSPRFAWRGLNPGRLAGSAAPLGSAPSPRPVGRDRLPDFASGPSGDSEPDAWSGLQRWHRSLSASVPASPSEGLGEPKARHPRRSVPHDAGAAAALANALRTTGTSLARPRGCPLEAACRSAPPSPAAGVAGGSFFCRLGSPQGAEGGARERRPGVKAKPPRDPRLFSNSACASFSPAARPRFASAAAAVNPARRGERGGAGAASRPASALPRCAFSTGAMLALLAGGRSEEGATVCRAAGSWRRQGDREGRGDGGQRLRTSRSSGEVRAGCGVLPNGAGAAGAQSSVFMLPTDECTTMVRLVSRSARNSSEFFRDVQDLSSSSSSASVSPTKPAAASPLPCWTTPRGVAGASARSRRQTPEDSGVSSPVHTSKYSSRKESRRGEALRLE
ncbi:NAD(+)/NADH kinase domain-containing protein [Besnoitia besnoiti]|uniref:NAD(+)/NADH kinase domain-containing protein n=1 Tax=Besnoitia besnoiti TaxID=94643 RepID=A0A2A9M352_BESBE|nr:NAD(+)/NADH kinase domain-containing protein [Besnoitia besnoiti]PFH32918.1 NAD(+)/NADH kinase domain-containing protein [Besnoitia besnoiti]